MKEKKRKVRIKEKRKKNETNCRKNEKKRLFRANCGESGKIRKYLGLTGIKKVKMTK